MTNKQLLIENLEKAAQTMDLAVSDLRQALPHCRGSLTTSSLLLLQDLKTAVKLSNNIEAHLSALRNPMEDDQ